MNEFVVDCACSGSGFRLAVRIGYGDDGVRVGYCCRGGRGEGAVSDDLCESAYGMVWDGMLIGNVVWSGR